MCMRAAVQQKAVPILNLSQKDEYSSVSMHFPAGHFLWPFPSSVWQCVSYKPSRWRNHRTVCYVFSLSVLYFLPVLAFITYPHKYMFLRRLSDLSVQVALLLLLLLPIGPFPICLAVMTMNSIETPVGPFGCSSHHPRCYCFLLGYTLVRFLFLTSYYTNESASVVSGKRDRLEIQGSRVQTQLSMDFFRM